jgi:hypothetical protein
MNNQPSAMLRAGLRWTDNVRESDREETTRNTDRKTSKTNSKRQRTGNGNEARQLRVISKHRDPIARRDSG